jgi:hypothetical protein
MVEPLPIRTENAPDDSTVVIRAGVMDPQSVQRAATRSFDGYGVLGVSVEAVIGRSVADACARSRRLDHLHFTLTLPDLSEITLARLERSFDGPIPNPGRPSPG